jgi:molybdate transport system substrate-binding protein
VRRTVVAIAALAGLILSGCSSSSSSTSTTSAAAGGSGSAASSSSAVTGTVTVLAAASLTESFTTIGKMFEAAHPGVTVKLSFGASSTLAQQINNGAPADVFASASTKNMTQVTDKGGASNPTNFVQNEMEIAVPPGNPAGVATVADLAKSAVKVALCEVQVPCGATAEKVFANAKVVVKPVTREPDVKATLTKVELKEVDAGVVYVTDVKSAGSKVMGVIIPADINASTEYPIAALTKAPNAAGAKAFVDYVLSAPGQQVLAAAGFSAP